MNSCLVGLISGTSEGTTSPATVSISRLSAVRCSPYDSASLSTEGPQMIPPVTSCPSTVSRSPAVDERGVAGDPVGTADRAPIEFLGGDENVSHETFLRTEIHTYVHIKCRRMRMSSPASSGELVQVPHDRMGEVVDHQIGAVG